MSLMEVLVALATILILVGILVGVGSYVKTRADVDLTDGMLDVLCTALTQYYDNQVPQAFPFVTVKDYDGDGIIDPYDQPHMEYDLQGTISNGTLPDHTGIDPLNSALKVSVSSASSAALFWFLDKDPSSRAIASAVDNSLITNKDENGVDIKIEINGTSYDLLRYVDAWGTSIRYEYITGTAFPVLTSAGPDKIFDTSDDITSK